MNLSQRFFVVLGLYAIFLLPVWGQPYRAENMDASFPDLVKYHFVFSGEKLQEDVLVVAPSTIYSKNSTFGYDLNSIQKDGKPFFFSVDVPEGNYLVRVVLGNDKAESVTTVKAESRRLMLLNVKNNKGEYSEHFFTVNIRNTKINETESVRINTREIGKLIWDNKLTLEFNGTNPSVSEIEITQNNNLPVIFLAGNSTVVDESNEPWCGWGQAFTCFLSPEIVVANHAESGLAAGSFVAQKRLDKIFMQMKSGDYLFIEFGHNDQKEQGEGSGPYRSYKTNLKYLVDKTREKGGIPVLITPMHRRNFDNNGKVVNTHGEYPAAMRQLAEEEKVFFIDLHKMSEAFYEAMGVENSKRAFVHYPKGTFPGQNTDLADNTHFNFYGGYQIAKCILRGIIDGNIPLKKYILPQYQNFDPAHPDDVNTFHYPPTPSFKVEKPDGS